MMRIVVSIFLLVIVAGATMARAAEVSRVLRTFDFEERKLGNAEDLPMHWAKVTGDGLPHYVNGKLTTDRHLDVTGLAAFK